MSMPTLRSFIARHRALAILVVAAALCMKLLVPSGFMIGQDSKVFTIQLCHDGLGNVITKQIVVPMKGEPADSHSKQGKGDCPFTSLSMASLTGADTGLLALALAFILALGFAPVRTHSAKPVSHLRPPLRGPPAAA